MTKNIFRIAAILVSGSLLSGCMFEQEDFFNESASLRVQNANDDIQKILCDQSTNGNGWVLQYFTAGTDEMSFPGFNILANFDNSGKVTLASDHKYLRNGNAGKYTEAHSVYQMLSEEGPMISFNTWNDILTVFSDPVDPAKAPESISPNGEGMRGDYNLVVETFGADEILLHGERYSAKSRLIPCDRPWDEYLAACKAMAASVYNDDINALQLTDGKETWYITKLHTGVVTLGERVVDPLKKSTLSAVFSPDGFRFQRLRDLGESAYQSFKYDDEKLCFVCLEDPNIVIKPAFETAADFFFNLLKQGNAWGNRQTFTSYGAFATLLDDTYTNFKKVNSSYKLSNISLVTNTEMDKLTLSFNYSQGHASNTSPMKFDYDLSVNGSEFSLSNPVAANTSATKNESNAIIKTFVDYMTDSFTVEDAARGVTRKGVLICKKSDTESKMYVAY